MFGAIRSQFKKLAGLKKKVEYHVEKQLALTFYAEIAVIFSFDKEMLSLCREMSDLLKADSDYSNLDACEKVNNKMLMRFNFLEHSRVAQKFVNAKKDVVERITKAMGKYA